jgi:hypothetical protein
MSALGQKRTWRCETAMSALTPKADIAERDWYVRCVPKAEVKFAHQSACLHELLGLPVSQLQSPLRPLD